MISVHEAIWNAVDDSPWTRFSRMKRRIGIWTSFFDCFRSNKLKILDIYIIQLIDRTIEIGNLVTWSVKRYKVVTWKKSYTYIVRVAHCFHNFSQLLNVLFHRLLPWHFTESLPGIILYSMSVCNKCKHYTWKRRQNLYQILTFPRYPKILAGVLCNCLQCLVWSMRKISASCRGSADKNLCGSSKQQ